jgi:hypothetical protein
MLQETQEPQLRLGTGACGVHLFCFANLTMKVVLFMEFSFYVLPSEGI